ncbi:OmpA family protein, partial [Myxococcota bacterium]|nr:OmpA family protein [Myxococcota bacterium]
TSMDESGRSATTYAWTVGLLYRVPIKVWKFTPFFKLEGGTIALSLEGAGTDYDRQAGMGGGVFFPVYKNWFGRVEVMGQITDGWDERFAMNLTLRAGIGYRWGFNNDRDGDGIINRLDKCPDDPEDFDNFEDTDGCPDPDNDGDGVKDKDDKCPGTDADKADNFAKTKEDMDGFEDGDGCPDPDNDKDGIPDARDKCPGTDADKADNFAKTKEDMDGFEDGDGCPDPDNDKDGIPDAKDKCPGKDIDVEDNFIKTKETINGFEDDDGCPDAGKPKVTVVHKKIEVTEKIFFEFNRARIQRRSFSVLNQVALTLKANPHILLVEIQGHAGTYGGEAANIRLSDRRAKAVRRYLISRGIAPSRLTAKGYGISKPVKDCYDIKELSLRKTCEAVNRRVQFKNLKHK